MLVCALFKARDRYGAANASCFTPASRICKQCRSYIVEVRRDQVAVDMEIGTELWVGTKCKLQKGGKRHRVNQVAPNSTKV